MNRNKRKKMKKEFDSDYWMEQVSEDQLSLEEHLLSQVNLQQLNKTEQNALRLLILNLDENGYLPLSLVELSTSYITEDNLQTSLNMLQQLEPYGVGARTLQECLFIQARIYGDNPLVEMILQDYFVEFADKRWRDLSKKMNVTLQEIQKSFDYIQTLNPRPASHFHQKSHLI